MSISTVAVIGGGTMGNGIAHVCAQNGCTVYLIEMSQALLDRAVGTITKNLDRQVSKGKLSEEDKAATLGRIKGTLKIEDVKNADIVIEAIVENEAVKKELFFKIDALAKPEAILASNTSTISITQIAAATKRANKFIGMHFMNPVPMMQLVEIIRGLATDDATQGTSETNTTEVEPQDWEPGVSLATPREPGPRGPERRPRRARRRPASPACWPGTSSSGRR